MPQRIVINGRFLAARTSGVQRVARELVRALDDDLKSRPGKADWEILSPQNASDLDGLSSISPRTVKGLSGVMWEQTALPWAARGATLVNLANTGPLTHKHNVVMIHDAQVFDTPASYSPAFRAWYKLAQPILGHRAKLVLTVSNFSRQRIEHNGIARLDRIKVIPNGVDHLSRVREDFSMLLRAGLKPNRFVLGFLSDQAHKNAALLLRLFERPRDDGLILALVGEKLPKDAPPPGPNVRILGNVSDRQLKGLYRAALALLLPSTTEGFGLPAGEAMQCGCPVLVADRAALSEYWKEAGLFAQPDEVESWRKLIDAMANDPSFKAMHAARAREVSQRYTWRLAAQRLRAEVEGMDAPLLS